jgi:RHS repeat-associated protein
MERGSKEKDNIFPGVFIVFAFAFLLIANLSSAGQKVYFYHTDAAGTPVAMTDAGGNVVWRADYKPFGEEQAITGSVENNEKFVGKEKDKETGLYYFGARYMDAKTGRFVSVDPKGITEKDLLNPQRLNRYNYSLNNPYRYIDPDGRWPSEIKKVHQVSINRVLSSIPKHDRNILNAQQVKIDADQSSSGAYKHAMRAPEQTAEKARQAANEFVHNEIGTARELEKTGQHDEALQHLGNAIHTMQDNVSPAHQGFQEWDENEDTSTKAEHLLKEFYDPRSGSALDAVTQEAWDIFKSNKPVPEAVFP